MTIYLGDCHPSSIAQINKLDSIICDRYIRNINTIKFEDYLSKFEFIINSFDKKTLLLSILQKQQDYDINNIFNVSNGCIIEYRQTLKSIDKLDIIYDYDIIFNKICEQSENILFYNPPIRTLHSILKLAETSDNFHVMIENSQPSLKLVEFSNLQHQLLSDIKEISYKLLNDIDNSILFCKMGINIPSSRSGDNINNIIMLSVKLLFDEVNRDINIYNIIRQYSIICNTNIEYHLIEDYLKNGDILVINNDKLIKFINNLTSLSESGLLQNFYNIINDAFNIQIFTKYDISYNSYKELMKIIDYIHHISIQEISANDISIIKDNFTFPRIDGKNFIFVGNDKYLNSMKAKIYKNTDIKPENIQLPIKAKRTCKLPQKQSPLVPRNDMPKNFSYKMLSIYMKNEYDFFIKYILNVDTPKTDFLVENSLHKVISILASYANDNTFSYNEFMKYANLILDQEYILLNDKFHCERLKQEYENIINILYNILLKAKEDKSIIVSEKRYDMQCNIYDKNVILTAKPDLLIIGKDYLYIYDLKTSQNNSYSSIKNEISLKNPQLLMYFYIISHNLNILNGDLGYIYSSYKIKHRLDLLSQYNYDINNLIIAFENYIKGILEKIYHPSGCIFVNNAENSQFKEFVL